MSTVNKTSDGILVSLHRNKQTGRVVYHPIKVPSHSGVVFKDTNKKAAQLITRLAKLNERGEVPDSVLKGAVSTFTAIVVKQAIQDVTEGLPFRIRRLRIKSGEVSHHRTASRVRVKKV